VVEDDYDGEFRYDGRPLESLQGLDRDGRVIYIGTFSRTVFSSLRIGYLIAPQGRLRHSRPQSGYPIVTRLNCSSKRSQSSISSGIYERYLRRSGNVMLDDGSPPADTVRIERVCDGHASFEAWTDEKGHFGFKVSASGSDVLTGDASLPPLSAATN
jgi:hypothetical protein